MFIFLIFFSPGSLCSKYIFFHCLLSLFPSELEHLFKKVFCCWELNQTPCLLYCLRLRFEQYLAACSLRMGKSKCHEYKKTRFL